MSWGDGGMHTSAQVLNLIQSHQFRGWAQDLLPRISVEFAN